MSRLGERIEVRGSDISRKFRLGEEVEELSHRKKQTLVDSLTRE